MRPRIVLINPPIYDFSAYDYWLKPFGLIRVAGFLRGKADLHLFDFMDRFHPERPVSSKLRSDTWDRGEFPSEIIPTPAVFPTLPRWFHRFGLSRGALPLFLKENGPFDFALIQTVMTYWYPGVIEVLETLRQVCPETRTILGGVYATLCTDHCRSLGGDVVIKGSDLDPLWKELGLEPDREGNPYWEGYPTLKVGVLKLAYGCPFRCTYCSVPQVEPYFTPYSLERSLRELEGMCARGIRNVAFYDDALLYRPENVLIPFLKEVEHRKLLVNFHTPNALNARFLSREIADRMVSAGFRTFSLGFESNSYEWQKRTGGKVYSHELATAVENLRAAGAENKNVTAYLILGHPRMDVQEMEGSIRFASDLGVRVLLSEFSPIPGTPDGEACRTIVPMDEPLWHNKTAFTTKVLGWEQYNQFKALCRELNERIGQAKNAGAKN